MSSYTPDVWVIVKLAGSKVQDSPYYRVLAGWYGGFAGSDSWKMNSGITKIVDCGTHYEIFGHSGSVYLCNKSVERFSGYTRSIFQSYANDNSDEVAISHINISEILGEFTNGAE